MSTDSPTLQASEPVEDSNYGRILKDGAYALVAAILLFTVGALTDAVDTFFEFSREYEDMELDEVLLALLGLGFGGFVFGVRRLHDQRVEIRKRIEAEAESARLALHDPLTGLPNRRLFEDRLNAALARAKREGEGIAVLMLDLDRFKPVNDLHGHGAGDKLLRTMSDRLSHALRSQDTLARFGGDEFAIIQVGGHQPLGALRLARRLLGIAQAPATLGNTQVSVGVSIGLAVYPVDGDDARSLVRRADIALYRAKQNGRGRFCFYEIDMDQHQQERAKLEQDLRAGIAAGQIEPFYQPIMDLRRGGLVGFEALARWRHPEKGVLAPDRFISVAEDSGQISDLCECLIRRACREAHAWPEDLTLAVNISPVQFRNPKLADELLAILKDEGLAPQRLEIEVTENALIEDAGTAARILSQLREAGVKTALDDFGTGYSSLAHLRDLAFDKIKIDRSFVSKLESNGESAAIVRAVIALGQSLGLPTIAEGIEDENHLVTLQAQGCALGQGYYFSKPVSADDVRDLIATLPNTTGSATAAGAA
ncbi:MAG: EAL domain-containing protein [Kiloniellales bacterium]|nr:EAL domain-containing protein [Kiloniellales bacterium]